MVGSGIEMVKEFYVDISVIINSNEEKYIEKCIKSLLNCKYKSLF